MSTDQELEFVTASACHTGGCVGVGQLPQIAVADTKLGADSPVLVFSTAEWADFLSGLKAGQFTRDKLLAAARARGFTWAERAV